MPVLPDVASTIVVRPGSMRPSASAASIIATPMRSLTLPPGLNDSTLANSSTPGAASSPTSRVSCTIGVPPTKSAMLTGIGMRSSLVAVAQLLRGGAEALGDVRLAALAHHVGAQLDVSRQPFGGEVAAGQHAVEPLEVAAEVVEPGDVLG